jgi:hypothetical protein
MHKFNVGDKVRYTGKNDIREGCEGVVIEHWLEIKPYEGGVWKDDPNKPASKSVLINSCTAELIEAVASEKDDLLEI